MKKGLADAIKAADRGNINYFYSIPREDDTLKLQSFPCELRILGYPRTLLDDSFDSPKP